MPLGKFPILHNVRTLLTGQLDSRAGSVKINPTALPAAIHSVRRLNDPNLGSYIRVVGAGTILYTGQSTFISRDTGYSGSPLSLVPFRPTNSINPYMYVADSARMRKIRADGVNYLMGIQPPTTSPVAELADPFFVNITDFGSGTHFTASGTAGAITNPARFSDTVAVILYDDPANMGWATVSPTGAMNDNYQDGAYISFAQGLNNDTTPIHDIFQSITATTISKIIYDSGTSGPCSITLTGPSSGLVPKALVVLGGTETVKIQSVINGADGVPAIRVTTASTHAAGDTITGLNSFYCYLNSTYTAGAVLGGSITAVAVTAGIGVITHSGSLNLSIMGGTRPVMEEDIVHASILFDVPGNVTQGWLEIDTSDGTFTGNYYSYNFSGNQLAPALSGAGTVTTAQQVLVQQAIISDASQQDADIPLGVIDTNNGQNVDSSQTVGFTTTPTGDSPSQAIVLGSSQWTELYFTVKDLIPIGSSQINSLATVAAIRVRVQVTGAVNMFASAWYIYGGYGPDLGAVGSPALYVYRYRSSTTGALSNPSPYTLNGLQPKRERLLVDVVSSTDPQVDQIDIFRFGIGLDQWTLVGSVSNSGGTVRFFDLYSALSITGNEIADFDNYVPFPVSDLSRSGVVDTSGITVKRISGDNFNTAWVPGSQIIINGVPYELYGSPSSTSLLQITQSAGANTSVKWYMPAPTIAGNPLPCMWGYGGQGIGTYLFGVGDTLNPGFLHWTKGNNADTASDKGNLEITSPSEPLINGFEYDSRNFVLSSERLFSILPDLSNPNGFTAQVVSTGKGLYGRYSLCLTPNGVAWVGTDGIYLWNGGAIQSISDADLYPIFPHGGEPGVEVNGYLPPDYSLPDSMRLGYSSSSIYFSYVDTNGTPQVIRYDMRLQGWFPESYPSPSTIVYQEEGDGVDSTLLASTTGFLYGIGIGSTDDRVGVQCQVRTPALDQGASRAGKLYTDFMLDYNSQSSTISLTLYFDDFSSNQVVGTVTGNSRVQSPLTTAPTSINLHRNIALDFQWTGAGTLYEFQPWFIAQPHIALQHFAQNVNFGNFTHMRDGWVGYISTDEVTLTAKVDGVDYSYKLPSSGGQYVRRYVVTGPLKGLLLGFAASCPSPFYLFGGDTIIRLREWGGDGAYIQYKPFGSMIEA